MLLVLTGANYNPIVLMFALWFTFVTSEMIKRDNQLASLLQLTSSFGCKETKITVFSCT